MVVHLSSCSEADCQMFWLQKYRLYLKRLSAVASQQANMVAAFGGRDHSYLPMGPLDGYGNFHTLAASGQLPALSSFQANGVLSGTNPAGYGLREFAASRIVQPGHSHGNTSNPINDLGKLQRINLPGSQHGNLLQGMPTTLEVDQLQQHKTMQDANIHLSGGFSGTGLTTGSSSNSFVNVTNNSFVSQAHQQHMQSKVLGNHSSVGMPSVTSDPFSVSVGGASHVPNLGRCNDTWQGDVPLIGHASNSFHHDDFCSSNYDCDAKVSEARAEGALRPRGLLPSLSSESSSPSLFRRLGLSISFLRLFVI